MTELYIARIDELLDEKTRQRYLPTVSKTRQEKVRRRRSAAGQAASLGAGMLLRWALYQRNIFEDETVTDEWGKPWVKACTSLYMSLSHSGDYVVCALGDQPLGVDIQKVGPVRESVLQKCYDEGERRILQQAQGQDKERLFAWIWAQKESYMKAVGKGLAIPMRAFRICYSQMTIDSDTVWVLRTWSPPGHELAFCGAELPQELERVSWNEYESIC